MPNPLVGLDRGVHKIYDGNTVITICICAYNRGENLRRTLESLANQGDIDEGALEVLVIDNR